MTIVVLHIAAHSVARNVSHIILEDSGSYKLTYNLGNV